MARGQSLQRREVEIKLRLEDAGVSSVASLKRKLVSLGLRLTRARTHEINWVFDDAAGTLRRHKRLLRLRRSGKQWLLTVKGPPTDGARHKDREEAETEITDGDQCRQAIALLGYKRTFIYERYRTTFENGGEVVIDETPLGVFLELEGRPRWIDATSKRLGADPVRHIIESYAELFDRFRRERRLAAANFTFADLAAERRQPRVARRG